MNITSGQDTNFDGVTTSDRPNQIADWHMPGHRTLAQKAAGFFNTGAFAAVPAGTATGLGTTSAYLIVGPGKVSTDLAAAKSFSVWRESKVQFRADAFNAFNHVNLGNPNVSAVFNAAGAQTSATFGTITGAAAGRILQLSLKLSF